MQGSSVLPIAAPSRPPLEPHCRLHRRSSSTRGSAPPPLRLLPAPTHPLCYHSGVAARVRRLVRHTTPHTPPPRLTTQQSRARARINMITSNLEELSISCLYAHLSAACVCVWLPSRVRHLCPTGGSSETSVSNDSRHRPRTSDRRPPSSVPGNIRTLFFHRVNLCVVPSSSGSSFLRPPGLLTPNSVAATLACRAAVRAAPRPMSASAR